MRGRTREGRGWGWKKKDSKGGWLVSKRRRRRGGPLAPPAPLKRPRGGDTRAPLSAYAAGGSGQHSRRGHRAHYNRTLGPKRARRADARSCGSASRTLCTRPGVVRGAALRPHACGRSGACAWDDCAATRSLGCPSVAPLACSIRESRLLDGDACSWRGAHLADQTCTLLAPPPVRVAQRLLSQDIRPRQAIQNSRKCHIYTRGPQPFTSLDLASAHRVARGLALQQGHFAAAAAPLHRPARSAPSCFVVAARHDGNACSSGAALCMCRVSQPSRCLGACQCLTLPLRRPRLAVRRADVVAEAHGRGRG